MLLDEFAAGFDLVAHQDAEEIVGAADVFHGDLQQRAVGGVERGVAELFGVHFAEAFEAGDLQALFAGGADGGGQAAEVFEAGFVFAAAERVAGIFAAGAFLGDEGLDREANLVRSVERGVDRADFVELDDAEARGRADQAAVDRRLAVAGLARRGVRMRRVGRAGVATLVCRRLLFLAAATKSSSSLAGGEPFFAAARKTW